MTPTLSYMLRAGFGLSGFYVLYALLLRRETHFRLNRLVLVGGLLLSFLIPAFPVASPFRTVAAPAPYDFPALPAAPARSIGFADVLTILYAAGVLLFLVRFGGHLLRLAGIIRRRGIRRLHGLKIVAVEQRFSPFSFLGLVFVNEGLAEQGNLGRILAHERVHIRQLHSLDLLLMEVVLSLQWFNPFVWPYKKAVQETHEYLADAGVIAQGFSSVKYQRLMFEQHVGTRLFEFGNNFKQSQIKRRISMLVRIPSSPAARLKALLALPLALMLVLVFAEPRIAASTAAPGLQEKVVPTEANRKEYLAQVEKEVVKISESLDVLKKTLPTVADEAARTELMRKMESLFQKRVELLARLSEAGVVLPPPPPPGAAAERLKKLELKEQDAKAALEKTTDPAQQAELVKLLVAIQEKRQEALVEGEMKMSRAELIAQLEKKAVEAQAELEKTSDSSKQAELQQLLEAIQQKRMEAAAGGKMENSKLNLEALQKMLAELKAMEADVRARLEKAADAELKAELEAQLKQIAQKAAMVKAKIAEAKDAGSEKIIR